MSDELTAEFDTVAGWTHEAAEALGPAFALPAACRGSGSPSALAWLAEAIGVSGGDRFLDSGAGVGGPAEWLRQHYGATVVPVEPMPSATRAAKGLFALPAVTAWSQSLPFPADSFASAWCLGVLDTTPDAATKRAVLEELHRVVVDGGAVGLLVLVRAADAAGDFADAPAGNDFPTHAELDARLTEAGFAVVQKISTGALAGAPVDWQARADRVAAEVARRHGSTDAYRQSQDQGERMARLLDSGQVASWLVHAVSL